MPDISRVVFIKSAPEGIRAISLGEELLLHGYQEIMELLSNVVDEKIL